jgi:predicted nuclease with TOPRIM domain
MDPKNFIRALQFALKDPDIRNDLSSIIGESVQTEITKLKSQLKDNEVVIKKLDTRINDLEKQVESLEQYSMRNCTRLSGLPKVK